MKNKIVQGTLLRLTFFCLLSLIFFQAESKATEYLRADFSLGYTNGNLVGQNSWGQVGTSNTNQPIQVTNNTASLKGVSSGSQSAYLNLTSPLDVTNTSKTNVFYYVFENFTVKEAYASSTSSGSGIATLLTNAGGSNNYARLYIRKFRGDSNAIPFDLGINSSGAGVVYGTNALAKNTSYKVVVAYTADPTGLDKTTVYVNPSGTNAATWMPEVTQTNTSDPSATLKSFVLQQGGLSQNSVNQFTLSRILVTDSVFDFNSPTFSYSPSSITGNAGFPISPNSPIQSGEFTRFSIQPSLPSGLFFNTNTGGIYGTPEIASSANYKITGSDSQENISATNQISITIQPPLIVYTPSAIQGTVGTYLSIVPTINGLISSYTISPQLPLGLTFNSLTGQISGLPLFEASSTHNVTVQQGLAGSYTCTITLQISSPTSLFNLLGASNFIQKTSGETVTSINDTSGSIANLQMAIDSARTTYPTNFLLINLQPGTTYQVTTNPLILGSKMCLSGASNTSIAASASNTTTSLIKITNGSSYTSVNFLTLNGNQANLYGIEAPGVNRVNLDRLIIRKTGKDGIFLQGMGQTNFDNEVTVTRCQVSEASTAAGIHLSDTTQAVCMDNLCYNNAYGILLESSSHAALINNEAKFNTDSGICLTNSATNKVTRNLCHGNGTGIAIAGSITLNIRNFLVSNDIRTSSNGISLGGVNNVVYDNHLEADIKTPLTLASGVGMNYIIPTSAPLTVASSQSYFYPPTIRNPHTSRTIANGKGVTTITTDETNLAAIQITYNNAQSNNPSSAIVLKLTAPQITGDAPLSLSSYTCILLNGTINLNPNIRAFTASNSAFISISGGTVSGQNTNGLYFYSNNQILIDQINWKNFGNKSSRVDGSDVVVLDKCSTPNIVQDCSLDGGGARGIWCKTSSGCIVSGNSSANMNMDGIDIDAYSSSSLVQFNSTMGNTRNGLFVEEGAKYNHLIGNLTYSNLVGINVHSELAGTNSFNTLIANTCAWNGRGIKFGATSPRETSHNFAFNNTIYGSTISAIHHQIYTNSENYLSQNYLTRNVADFGDIAQAVFFNPPYSTASLTTSVGYFNWQQSFGWSASASLPNADPNGNGVSNLLEYALGLDPLSTTPPTLPVVGWDTTTPDGPWLTFTYRRNKSAMDLTYVVQTSTDLVTWTSILPNTTSVISTDASSDLLRIAIQTSPAESKRFLRLSVTRQ
jgi:parallel beta-helix repeat protein